MMLPVRIVVPLTEWRDEFHERPWMIQLRPTKENGITKVVAADAVQVKCVSTERLKTRMGCITAHETDDIAAAVAMVVGYRG